MQVFTNAYIYRSLGIVSKPNNIAVVEKAAYKGQVFRQDSIFTP